MSNKHRDFGTLYTRMYPGKSAMQVTFIVTHQCNMRCSYCYERDKSDARMDFGTAKRCIDRLFDEDARDGYVNHDNADALILDFIGGEPFLEVQLIDQVLDYFRGEAVRHGHRWATKYMASFSSNGLLYFDKDVQRFVQKNKGRLSIGVTVDGDQETHDSCRLDCNGCPTYSRSNAAFLAVQKDLGMNQTKVTIAPGNVHRAFEACKDIIKKNNLDYMGCNCVFEDGWTDELAGVLYGQLKQLADWLLERGYGAVDMPMFDEAAGHPLPDTDTQNWCGGTGKMLAFDVDGTCYPCLRYAPLSVGNRPPLRIGDCEHGIGVLSEDAATIDMLNAITRQSQSPDKCLSCPIASGCAWCSGYNYEVFGTPNKRATFICPTHIARTCANAYYHNTAYKRGLRDEPYEFTVPREWAVPIIGAAEFDVLKELSASKGECQCGGTDF